MTQASTSTSADRLQQVYCRIDELTGSLKMEPGQRTARDRAAVCHYLASSGIVAEIAAGTEDLPTLDALAELLAEPRGGYEAAAARTSTKWAALHEALNESVGPDNACELLVDLTCASDLAVPADDTDRMLFMERFGDQSPPAASELRNIGPTYWARAHELAFRARPQATAAQPRLALPAVRHRLCATRARERHVSSNRAGSRASPDDDSGEPEPPGVTAGGFDTRLSPRGSSTSAAELSLKLLLGAWWNHRRRDVRYLLRVLVVVIFLVEQPLSGAVYSTTLGAQKQAAAATAQACATQLNSRAARAETILALRRAAHEPVTDALVGRLERWQLAPCGSPPPRL